MTTLNKLKDFVNQSSNVGYLLTSTDFKIISVNDKAIALLALEVDGLFNQDLTAILEHREQDNPLKIFQTICQKTSKLIGYETASVNDPKITLIWDIEKKNVDTSECFLMSIYEANELKDEQEDITSYFNKINKLHFSEKILNELPGIVYWKDEDGVYLGCNQNMVDLAGKSTPEDIIGKTDYDLFDSELAENLRKNDKSVKKSETTQEIEEIAELSNGDKNIFISQKTPLKNDKNENIGILGSSINITKQVKQQNKLLKENNESIKFLSNFSQEITGQKIKKDASIKEQMLSIKNFLDNLIYYLPGYIFWKDTNSVYLGCNNGHAKILGLESPKDIIGKTDYDLFTKNQAEHLISMDKKVISEKKEILVEESGIIHDGSTMNVLTCKLPLFDEKKEKVIAILGMSLDITQQKKDNALLQIFAGAVAHELRTPLTTIGNNVQGISRYIDSLYKGYKIAQEHNLEVPFIRKNHLEILPRITQDIIDEVNFSQSIINVNLAQVGLHNTNKADLKICHVQSTIKTAIERYPFKNSKERELIHHNTAVDFEFIGSELLMVHVLLNLLKNALYFIESSDKGNISITCINDGDYNELHFTDTGPGIPAEQKNKIFDQFYSKRQHGTGIGLAFCKQVIESFKGSICCESEVGEYTKFVIRLPSVSTFGQL